MAFYLASILSVARAQSSILKTILALLLFSSTLSVVSAEEIQRKSLLFIDYVDLSYGSEYNFWMPEEIPNIEYKTKGFMSHYLDLNTGIDGVPVEVKITSQGFKSDSAFRVSDKDVWNKEQLIADDQESNLEQSYNKLQFWLGFGADNMEKAPLKISYAKELFNIQVTPQNSTMNYFPFVGGSSNLVANETLHLQTKFEEIKFTFDSGGFPCVDSMVSALFNIKIDQFKGKDSRCGLYYLKYQKPYNYSQLVGGNPEPLDCSFVYNYGGTYEEYDICQQAANEVYLEELADRAAKERNIYDARVYTYGVIQETTIEKENIYFGYRPRLGTWRIELTSAEELDFGLFPIFYAHELELFVKFNPINVKGLDFWLGANWKYMLFLGAEPGATEDSPISIAGFANMDSLFKVVGMINWAL
ncbi:MAG: hypothetical protein OEZ43_20535 [Gammaproteobacteria bacterium]|nr:hypothetical protein [Gammaproteobacteria bacterium]